MMTLREITLNCGCFIGRELPHLDTCKCNDVVCLTGYWFMVSTCSDHCSNCISLIREARCYECGGRR
jgi:hypothetical protein